MPRKIEAKRGEGRMVVTLKSYLARLEESERAKPEERRRSVPQLRELARDIGVNPVTLSNVANNHIELLNLDMGARIIAALRRRGFEANVSDILAYEDAAQQ